MVPQLVVARLDLREHAVEVVGQRAHLVVAPPDGAERVVAARRHVARGLGELQDRRRDDAPDQPGQPGRERQHQHEHGREVGQDLHPALHDLAEVELELHGAQGVSVEPHGPRHEEVAVEEDLALGAHRRRGDARGRVPPEVRERPSVGVVDVRADQVRVQLEGAERLARGGGVLEREGGRRVARHDVRLDGDVPHELRAEGHLVVDRHGAGEEEQRPHARRDDEQAELAPDRPVAEQTLHRLSSQGRSAPPARGPATVR